MRNFRERKFDFLIATDVAARGLDVDDLEVVFNFDLPNDAEDYTHRVGRTGRAGRQGRAFTFVSGQEIYKLQGMVRWAKLDIRRGRIPSLDEVEEARGNAFFERIRATLEARQFKPRDRMIDRLLDQGYASTDICSALIHLLQGGGEPSPEAAASAKPARPAAAAAPSAPVSKPTPTSPKPAVAPAPRGKSAFERPARTGREAGMATVRLNAGSRHGVTAADIVGKIAGVTRLPASIVGAIDLLEDHALVDVEAHHAELIVKKLARVRVKGVSLEPRAESPAA